MSATRFATSVQNIFDILVSFKGCHAGAFPFQEVLDVFAGTGAMGIEALSRGASRATFVENDQDVLKVLNKNLKVCGFSEETEVIPLNTFETFNFFKSLQLYVPW